MWYAAKLAYRIAQWILPMPWHFGRKPACSAVADPPASSPEEWPESGLRSGIWCLAHAVDE
jgi:hypothetical protein